MASVLRRKPASFLWYTPMIVASACSASRKIRIFCPVLCRVGGHMGTELQSSVKIVLSLVELGRVNGTDE